MVPKVFLVAYASARLPDMLELRPASASQAPASFCVTPILTLLDSDTA